MSAKNINILFQIKMWKNVNILFVIKMWKIIANNYRKHRQQPHIEDYHKLSACCITTIRLMCHELAFSHVWFTRACTGWPRSGLD